MTARHASIVLTSVPSAWGPMRIAAGEDGVVAAELLGTEEGFRAAVERRRLGRLVALEDGTHGRAADLARLAGSRLGAGLAGDHVDLSVVPVDLSDRPAWDQLVLGAVRTIGRGETASYGEIARRIGRPGAARAVGGAVARNPVGVLVPCHRVIAGDGSLGGYGAAAWGGVQAALALKRALLGLEGVDVR
jgi:methylated-DNA-[protein]-cysteine S-methyltransferase